MSMFQKLATLLGVREDQVDDALKDARRAHRQLSRRGLLAAGAAIVGGQLLPAGGRVWSLPAAEPMMTAWTVDMQFSMAGEVWKAAYVWTKMKAAGMLGGISP